MNWSNVKLIWQREVRDQFRDRRTMFMIAVLPLLLYPLLGMSFMQVAQFLQDHPTRVLVVGWEPLADLPNLVEKGSVAGNQESKLAPGESPGGDAATAKTEPVHFTTVWTKPDDADAATSGAKKMAGANLAKLLDVDAQPAADFLHGRDKDALAAAARERMKNDNFDLVLYFPPDFAKRLDEFHRELANRAGRPEPAAPPLPTVPSPEIFHDSVKEKSQVALARVSQIVGGWQDAIGAKNLLDSNVPQSAGKPFEIEPQNLAEAKQQQAAVWAKILPFVLLLWALTGAFYPAIDLCAGEKERGTLETLLCSPAQRSEIVAGKLGAVMLFSMATSILNLLSMGVTAWLVGPTLGKLANDFPVGFPPLSAMLWLLAALVPASALFSALCLALAVFARSTKEGQYYLMPLILIAMPLMVLPLAPGVELTLGNSLIPLTGLILLLRKLLEGGVWDALRYIPPVALVTFICCRIAMRWAVDQFNKESVLFRESERWDFRLWVRHLWRDREPTPTLGMAMFCGVLILSGVFFLDFLLASWKHETASDLVRLIVVSQLAVLAPTVLLTFTLTRDPIRTWRLGLPCAAGARPEISAEWGRPVARVSAGVALLAAAVLAVVLQPFTLAAGTVLTQLFPVAQDVKQFDASFATLQTLPPWAPYLLIGLLPAVCEELAFRGFILSGLRHSGNKWRAIFVSSVFFALTHQILQQSMLTFCFGVVLGYLCVQTGSLWPGVVFHAIHNSLGWVCSVYGKRLEDMQTEHATLCWFSLLLGIIAAGLILAWFGRLQYRRTDEEEISEAIKHEEAGVVGV